MTIIEVVISLAVVSIGAMSTLACLVTTWSTDEELRERAQALRAATTVMESVVAFDYGGDIQNLVTFYTDPNNSTFEVEDLVPAGAPGAENASASGTIAIDASDPDRIQVTVTIDWVGGKGARSLSVPLTLTELTP